MEKLTLFTVGNGNTINGTKRSTLRRVGSESWLSMEISVDILSSFLTALCYILRQTLFEIFTDIILQRGPISIAEITESWIELP